MLSLFLSALAADPQIGISWKKNVGTVHVLPAPGQHVGDAPAHLTIQNGNQRFELGVVGNPEGMSLPLTDGTFSILGEVSFCNDGGTECRLVEFAGAGMIAGKKGSLSWPAVAPPLPPPKATTGAVKLIYFSAVWCPPCNLMAAQVMDVPDQPELAPFTVERLDVDRPDSWPLKSRYHVGGYPTLVAVDANGNEVARQVGYPGEAMMKAWLQRLPGLTPLADLEAGQPLTGEAASAAARRLAEAEKPEAAQKYFAAAADGTDLRIAKLLVNPNKEDAAWLLEHQAPAGDWLYSAMEEAPEKRAEILPYLLTAERGDVAGYLEALASGPDETILKAAAIRMIQAELTGDPDKDRGWYTDLAGLYADVGQLGEAEKLLASAIERWPKEFTWHYVLARLRLDAKKFSEAEGEARAAYEAGYGDQRLRAAMVLAKVLKAEKRQAEAIAVLDGALAEIPEPPAGVEVRTHRYRQQVTDLKAEILKP